MARSHVQRRHWTGRQWVDLRGKIPVQVYTPDGKLVKYWGQDDGLFQNPRTIRFDSAGNL